MKVQQWVDWMVLVWVDWKAVVSDMMWVSDLVLERAGQSVECLAVMLVEMLGNSMGIMMAHYLD